MICISRRLWLWHSSYKFDNVYITSYKKKSNPYCSYCWLPNVCINMCQLDYFQALNLCIMMFTACQLLLHFSAGRRLRGVRCGGDQGPEACLPPWAAVSAQTIVKSLKCCCKQAGRQQNSDIRDSQTTPSLTWSSNCVPQTSKHNKSWTALQCKDIADYLSAGMCSIQHFRECWMPSMYSRYLHCLHWRHDCTGKSYTHK